MKVEYKGFIIDAHRAKSLGGATLLYYSIFRKKDMFECVCDFSYGSDTVRTWIKLLKERVDEELKEADPWNEKRTREYYY